VSALRDVRPDVCMCSVPCCVVLRLQGLAERRQLRVPQHPASQRRLARSHGRVGVCTDVHVCADAAEQRA
jgi:hypothetical protein